MKSDVVFSKASDLWGTPRALFDQYDQRYRFTVDAAADRHNHLTPVWFGPGGTHEDALTAPWQHERVWLNPPYSQTAAFLQRAVEAVLAPLPAELVVVLIPARTDTRYFHEIILPHATEIRFIRGRLRFGGAVNSAPFPSIVIVFDNRNSK